jgi:hypothetical protein
MNNNAATSEALALIATMGVTAKMLENFKDGKPVTEGMTDYVRVGVSTKETVYCTRGGMILPMDKSSLASQPKLEASTYRIVFDPEIGMGLVPCAGFSLPKKVYGNYDNLADRYLKTFEDRPAGTGVLLTGEKGSGKTLLARKICIEAIKRGYPILILDRPYKGAMLGPFLQALDCPAVVFVDEFEKVYAEQSDMDSLLTVMDGSLSSKKMYLLTSNSTNTISPYMSNRPGRVYYTKNYGNLDVQVAMEYIEDQLRNKAYKESLYIAVDSLNGLNFDSLTALVEDINRFNCAPSESLSHINLTSGKDQEYYEISCTWKGKPLEEVGMSSTALMHGASPNCRIMEQGGLSLRFFANPVNADIEAYLAVRELVKANAELAEKDAQKEDLADGISSLPCYGESNWAGEAQAITLLKKKGADAPLAATDATVTEWLERVYGSAKGRREKTMLDLRSGLPQFDINLREWNLRGADLASGTYTYEVGELEITYVKESANSAMLRLCGRMRKAEEAATTASATPKTEASAAPASSGHPALKLVN